MSDDDVINKYFKTTNEIFGVLAIGIGLGCFSAGNTQFYAWVGLMFIALAWWSSFSEYRIDLKRISFQKNTKLSMCNIIRNCYVAIIGWVFLGCIALGILDTNGFSFF